MKTKLQAFFFPLRSRYFLWFFLVYAVYGLISTRDFGIPLDEFTQRYIGIENNLFLKDQDPEHIEKHKFFGPVFESVSYLLEQPIFGSDMMYKIWMRHLLLFCIFGMALLAVFRILRTLTRNYHASAMATIALALYPPIFAHAHYNSKDTFFLCLLVFAFYFFMQFRENNKLKILIVSAAILGISCTVRFNAVFALAALLPCFFIEHSFKTGVKYAAIYSLVFVCGLYLFYPYLWLHPVTGIAEIFSYINSNPWPSSTLAAGREILPGNAPGWYLPAWLLVSIPIPVILLFFTGLCCYFRNFKRQAALYHAFLLLFFLPVLYTIILRPTLYDGWRHLQFLLLPITVFAGLGVHVLWKWLSAQTIVVASVIYSAIVFIGIHPFGYLYFNELKTPLFGPNSFTQDYWNLSAFTALEEIKADQPGKSITVSSFTETVHNQLIMHHWGNGMVYVPNDSAADYYIEIRRNRWLDPALDHKVWRNMTLKQDTFARIIKTIK